MSITVCLPPSAADRVEEAVAEAMAPFEIDYARGEDLDIWDAWRITGGTVHGGGFPVVTGAENDVRLIHEIPSRFLSVQEVAPNDFGWCAGGPRGLLDLSASYEQAVELADAAWLRWRELARDLPAPSPWQAFLARHDAAPLLYTSQHASADYWAQPLVRAFTAYVETLPVAGFSFWFLRPMDPVARIGSTPREEFVAKAAAWALNRRNVLTLEGWWHEDGGAGVHGRCDTPAACPHAPDVAAGQEHVDAYLKALPDDVLLVNVHCHV
ncbi:hypothetical protein ACGFX4_09970 [Kitasatospora sp. NPDC048365]|uniref:hypothetical protein n=1 Tax=Kitasatospora sp. NPDC048365 TaxID=3364050 RepID=UPI00370FF929